MSEIQRLAHELQRQTLAPGDGTYLRRATVTAVNRTLNTYTLSLGGAFVENVPSNMVAIVGDAVDVLFDGPGARIIGVQGLMSWQTPVFQNGWNHYGGGYYQAGYARDSNGYIHLRGMVAGGTMPGTVFTLPVGYRPGAYSGYMPIVATSQFNMVMIMTDGQVGIHLPAGGNTWVALDGVLFPVA